MVHREAAGRQGFGLGRALLVSLAIHLLLLLINPILSRDRVDPSPPEETALHFDLAPAAESPPESPPEPPPPEPEPAEPLSAAAPPEPPPPAIASLARGSPVPGDDPEEATSVPGLAGSKPEPARPQQEPRPPRTDPGDLDDAPGVDLPEPGPLPRQRGEDGRSLVERRAELPQPPLRAEPRDPRPSVPEIEPPTKPSEKEPSPPSEDAPDRPPGSLNLPDSMAMPHEGFQFGDAWAESGDPRLASYLRTLLIYLNRLNEKRRYMDRGRFERWAYTNDAWYTFVQPVKFRFSVRRNGEMVDLVFENASGVRPLDDALRDALAEAVLQPLPADYPGERETFHMIMRGGELQMREFLRRLELLKRYGLF